MNRKMINIAAAVIAAMPLALSAAPNDSLYQNHQWYLQNQKAAAINAEFGWNVGLSGKGVTIAVVDSGYAQHQDLGSNVIPGYDFVSLDDPSNGFAFTDGDNQPGRDSDARDPGDYVDANYLNRMRAYVSPAEAANLSSCQSADVKDSSWHGVMVSGILAAKANNNIGISGVVPNAKVVVSRALGKCGGHMNDIMDAARWSAGLPVDGVPANPNPAKIINLSLSSKGACGASEQKAIDEIVAHGAVVVVAAGNQGGDVADYSPASCKNVIVVGSVSSSGARTSYSNYGKNVIISAPGGSGNAPIAAPSHKTANKLGPIFNNDSSQYVQARGTSFAAPLVSGVIAMMLEANPELSQPEIVLALRASAKAFPQNVVNQGDDSLGACDSSRCGAGILDAKAAIEAVSGENAQVVYAAQAENARQIAVSQAPAPEGKAAGGAFSIPALMLMMGMVAVRFKK